MNDVHTSWRERVESRFGALYDIKTDKRMDLAEAVRRFVEPGMSLNPVMMQSRPSAALHEVCRQFAGRDPGFELISSAVSGSYLQLAHLGLLRKAIVSFVGEGYPTPGPSPVTGWALERGGFEIENWSMLTITQRLMAGALGLPFIPTNSITGSSMAVDNAAAGQFAQIVDPFHPDRMQGVVAAYRPDISFVFVWAADKAGNALCFPPYQENIYGALAAKKGVILVAHQIVSTDFIRRHSHLLRIPAEIVLSVSEAPYGSHPYGNFSQGIPEFVPYANDYPFMRRHREAQSSRETYDAWMQEWILGVKDWDEYLQKLGRERIDHIHAAAWPDSWKQDLEACASELDKDRPPNAIETMVVQGAREVARRIACKGYRTVLSGVGLATLMCWLADIQLREQGIEFSIMAETGMYGFEPRPGDPFLTNYRNLPTCRGLADVFEILGMHSGGASSHCLAAMGAGQLDRFGNVNSTRTASGQFIVGSGGANDIVTTAAETMIVAAQRRSSFVERVDYITSPGQRVGCVISTLGRFEKRGGEELILTGVFAQGDQSQDVLVDQVRKNCGWDLIVADDLEVLPHVTHEEVALLRLFDPERSFLGKSERT